MNLREILSAVDAGYHVHWSHDGYEVIKDCNGQYLIKCLQNNDCIGLTWSDGKTLNGSEDQFFRAAQCATHPEARMELLPTHPQTADKTVLIDSGTPAKRVCDFYRYWECPTCGVHYATVR